jgi:hypothetical protein
MSHGIEQKKILKHLARPPVTIRWHAWTPKEQKVCTPVMKKNKIVAAGHHFKINCFIIAANKKILISAVLMTMQLIKLPCDIRFSVMICKVDRALLIEQIRSKVVACM